MECSINVSWILAVTGEMVDTDNEAYSLFSIRMSDDGVGGLSVFS